jgi:hypothetical protein
LLRAGTRFDLHAEERRPSEQQRCRRYGPCPSPPFIRCPH